MTDPLREQERCMSVLRKEEGSYTGRDSGREAKI